jgi:dTDP-4-dehydrorhamnose 3,5-epimerase
MEILSTEFAGLKVVQLKIYHDNRGFFVERFNKKLFQDLGLPVDYFQDNHSLSAPNVIRGLHFQNNPSQAKLVGCLRGKILDVAVDIRKNSPTFGKYFSIELSAENGKLLFIPAGFAHGFAVIGDEPADVMYKVDNQFSKEGDGGIRFNDPDLKIDWQIANPIISDKDKNLPLFADYLKNPKF